MSSLMRILSQFRAAPRNAPIRAIPRTLFQTASFFASVHLFAEYVMTVRPTQGPSMLPTIQVRDDWVFISKLHRRGKNIEVGDVVSMIHSMAPERGVIKRVLGMEGDFVLMHAPGGAGEEKMLQVGGRSWVVR